MALKITESDIEQLAIELLQEQGYTHLYGPDIAPEGKNPQRESFGDVVLERKLKSAIDRINPSVPASARDDALQQIKRINASQLIDANKTFHQMLTEGVRVTFQKDGNERGDIVWLVDFDNIENNQFDVVNQLDVVENGNHKKPDVVLFVNGIPLVVMELKNLADPSATVQSAFQQLRTYKAFIPSLFTFNSILVVSDALDARAGTIAAGFSRFSRWKTIDGEIPNAKLVPEMETMIKGMLKPQVLLDLTRNFIVFEQVRKENQQTRITQIDTVKKLAAYHQYNATNEVLKSVRRASSAEGDHKGGVVWHTQGSGKSLTMVFSAGKIVRALNNPTIVVITDRNDLDEQLFQTFAASKHLLRQEPVQAESRADLKKLLSVASGGVVFTTIQKFWPEEGNVYDQLSDRTNIVVIADEAHRTQYGFEAKIDEVKNEITFGFAKYMRDALPNATYLGFTGTPIERDDINTPKVFGKYVDIYDVQKAVDDKATVPIYYASRLAKVELDRKGRERIKKLEDELDNEELSETQKNKAQWTQLEALIGSSDRVKKVAEDIINHFDERQTVLRGKAMIVAISRRVAVRFYNQIIKLRPEWHSDDLNDGAIKVVMTSPSSEGSEMAQHHTTKEQRRKLAARMKNPNDKLKIVIVVDMWLTGFDVPCLHTLYVDKPMRGHNLMQAIARVNRVYPGKEGGGLVVDYLGIAADLKKALSFYSDSGGKGEPAIAQEKAVAVMLEKLEVVSQMLRGLDYEKYFSADTSQKLSIILGAEDYILGLQDGKKRFLDNVAALSKAFAIAMPHDDAVKVRKKIAFFQAISSRLAKFNSIESNKTDVEMETAIRQVIDEALVSSKVINVFDAAGIKKPKISILSEEFLLEVKSMKHQNLALEVLKKLLNDEIKVRTRKNLIQGKKLMELLEESINRYHNKVITSTEVINELIKLANDIKAMDDDHKKLNLTDYEYAFYTAVADNASARELMKSETLRELAVVLTDRIQKNATIDWTVRESVRAKLKITVKRILKKYGYPPDAEKLATDSVIKQAELIAADITS